MFRKWIDFSNDSISQCSKTSLSLLTTLDDFSQSSPVFPSLCDGFAESQRFSSPIVDCQVEMMRSDGTSDSVATLLYRLDCFGSGGMFQDYTQFWETSVNGMEMGKEMMFCVQDCDVLRGRKKEGKKAKG